MSKAMPAYMYQDPMQAAMRAEAQSCQGCASTWRSFAIVVCMLGKKHGNRCKDYIESEKGTVNV